MSCTYHLQFVLPKLLLLGLVEKREVAHMVNEYEAQQRELRVLGSNLAGVGAEGRAKALEGGGRREFGDFILCLARDELALEIYEGSVVVGARGADGDRQCSCLPVSMEPSGGTDIMDICV
jgi:hypothetical protein